jgi:hypothetical protein
MMNIVDWLSIISGIVGIAGFIFGIWAGLRADTRVKEIKAAMQTLHDIADNALWESHMLASDDGTTRVIQLERSMGLVSAMRTISARYVGDQQSYRATELGTLLVRGVIWTNAMITSLELSNDVRTIWLVTPDLEPDLSESTTASVVKKNLIAGKSYIYFYAASIKSSDEKIRRVKRNIGANDPTLGKNVEFVAMDDWMSSRLIPMRGNIILFFKDDPAYGTELVFLEVVLSKVSKRGLFWQECERADAAQVFETLRKELPSLPTAVP